MVWYFAGIVTYIIIATLLSLMGNPLVKKLNKIRFGKRKMPHALSATLTLFSMILIFGLFQYRPYVVAICVIVLVLALHSLFSAVLRPFSGRKKATNELVWLNREPDLQKRAEPVSPAISDRCADDCIPAPDAGDSPTGVVQLYALNCRVDALFSRW